MLAASAQNIAGHAGSYGTMVIMGPDDLAFSGRAQPGPLQRVVGLPTSDYPWGRVSLKGDLHALVLIRVVFEMHDDAVSKLERDQSVVHDLAAPDLRIHDLVEAGVRPPALFPTTHQIAITKECDRRLDRKIDRAEGELKIELADPHLGRELSNDRPQVEVIRNTVHFGQYNAAEGERRHRTIGRVSVRSTVMLCANSLAWRAFI
jgi:hypothetical protein